MATAQAVATFTASGWDVAIPLTESAAYDLVVDDGTQLARVQCKYISGRQVDLRRIHSNGSGYVVKLAAPDSYDWLYVLTAEGRQYLVRQCLAERRAFNVQRRDEIGGLVSLPETMRRVESEAVREVRDS